MIHKDNRIHTEVLPYDKGSVIIERLMRVYSVQNRPQLSTCIGVTIGTMSTWHTRNSTPYEILIRVSLLKGVSLQWLCFGEGEMYEENEPDVSSPSSIVKIVNSKLKEKSNATIQSLIESYQTKENDIELFNIDGVIHLIDVSQKEAVNGFYLFAVNENFQTGELKLLPDGNTYLIEDKAQYKVDTTKTKVHGKILAILQKKE